MSTKPRAPSKGYPKAKAKRATAKGTTKAEAKEAQPIDWELVEKEFRAGQFSIREIAKRHEITDTTIHKRARRDGWTRELAHKIPAAVRERLARQDGLQKGLHEGLHASHAMENRNLLDNATTVGADVVKLHRKDIAQLHEIKAILAKRLIAHLNNEELDGPCLGERETAGDLLEKLGRTTARLIPLERQAYSIDEAPVREDPLDEIMGIIDGQRWTATAA
jgi:hypothetical protein